VLKSEALANHLQDDGFHEIQLNGKQLVFLFMAATVVSVVIFLCGVLVGRGVRAERGGPIADATFSSAPAPGGPGSPSNPGNPAAAQSAASPANPASNAGSTDAQPPQSPSASQPAGSDPTAAAPPPTVDDLTYFNRLEKQKTSRDDLKTPPAKSGSAAPAGKQAHTEVAHTDPPRTEAHAAAPPRSSPPPPATPPAPAREQPGAASSEQGFSIQIAALGERTDADTLAKGLSSKGYTAYVLPPASGAPTVFRVRVGKFNSRQEAESIAAKLKKEEHFNPWITR
jgi:DedD protein